MGRVSVFTFGSSLRAEALNRELLGLGYVPELLDKVIWQIGMRSLRHRFPIVLLLGREEVPRERLCAFLGESQAIPRLGVFERETFHCHSRILSHCTDFQAWPCDRGELALRLRRAGFGESVALDVDDQRLRSADFGESEQIGVEGVRSLRREFARLNLLGRSTAFVRVLQLIKKLGRSDAPVLVRGETGTGKELAARAIHYLGDRHGHPFVPVNCGAIPDNLVESELFGHERGAFTDAKGARAGLVAQADGGTLFLDEVDALSAKAQVALLRFLEDHEYRPLGARGCRRVDVRVVAATNQDLEALVARGVFRQDLLFRLNILLVKLPPLAARYGDVELLARHFLEHYGRRYGRSVKCLHPRAVEWMNAHRWPGNVRELENLTHRAVVIAEGPMILLRHILQAESGGQAESSGGEQEPLAESFSAAKTRTIEQFERSYLTSLLAETGGNVTQAAKRAGKERRAFGKLLKKHHIDRDRYIQ